MNKIAIMSKVPRIVHKSIFQLKKRSPEILVAAGVVGMIASAVTACKATTKLEGILEEHKEQVDRIHWAETDEEIQESGAYTAEDVRNDLVIVYTQTAVKLIKLYAPSVILGALSVTSILASYNILHKRNVALGAAYTALDHSFREYRNRAVERYGEQADKEMKYGIRKQKVEELVTDPETGEQKKVEKTVEVTDMDGYSQYARFFDEGSREWTKDPEANLNFLRVNQQYANDLLVSRGYLFLNEVYRLLDIPETKAGQIVGWIYDPECPNGDNWVDFGIYNINRAKNRDFVNGYERCILLDFNVDGPIIDKMP